MCLKIRNGKTKPKVADSDIVCYKVLKKFPNGEILRAPIYNFEYTFGMIYSTHKDYFSDIDVCDDGECLAEYGFHSFVELSGAVRFKERLLNSTRHSFGSNIKPIHVFDFVVVKCTIPNGARYYTGKQIFSLNEDNYTDGYCSEAIRIDEIVNENET